MELDNVWYKSKMLWTSVAVIIASLTSAFTGVGVVVTGTELTLIVELVAALGGAIGVAIDRILAHKKTKE